MGFIRLSLGCIDYSDPRLVKVSKELHSIHAYIEIDEEIYTNSTDKKLRETKITFRFKS